VDDPAPGRPAEGTRIVGEEQFGPALPVMAYRTVPEAVERANATSFGLSGSVWGADADEATRVAAPIDGGVVFVNDHLTLEPHLPFGGVKWSGAGWRTARGGWRSSAPCGSSTAHGGDGQVARPPAYESSAARGQSSRMARRKIFPLGFVGSGPG
jgi:hypothetical protein